MGERALVVGGAGFIGSNLVERLVGQGYSVAVVDNLTLGKKEYLKGLIEGGITFLEKDFSNPAETIQVFRQNEVDIVFHLAANSDIRRSAADPDVDFQNTFMTTLNIVRAMSQFKVRKLVFASTSAIYGDPGDRLISEDSGPLLPESYYGGAKLASEAFISAYANMNDFKVWICRFPNVVGRHGTHGVVFDFIRKLRANRKELLILGDGQQRKPYIHIEDLLDAILLIVNKTSERINFFNIGVDDQASVTQVADIVCKEMGLQGVHYRYTGGTRGWAGDIPQYRYNTSKLKSLGWVSRHTSSEAVRDAARILLDE